MVTEAAFYTFKDVRTLTTWSRFSVNRAVASNLFPKPVRISEKRKLWPREVVDAWLADKLANREAAASINKAA